MSLRREPVITNIVRTWDNDGGAGMLEGGIYVYIAI